MRWVAIDTAPVAGEEGEGDREEREGREGDAAGLRSRYETMEPRGSCEMLRRRGGGRVAAGAEAADDEDDEPEASRRRGRAFSWRKCDLEEERISAWGAGLEACALLSGFWGLELRV